MYQLESGVIQRNESHPVLQLGVVAIEKGAFVSPLTMVTNFTLFFIYKYKAIYIYIYIYIERERESTDFTDSLDYVAILPCYPSL